MLHKLNAIFPIRYTALALCAFAMLLSLLKRPVLSGFGLKKGPSLSKALINSAPSPCTRTS